MKIGEKKSNRKINKRSESEEIAVLVGNSIMTAYFLVMMVLFPLYIKGGYQEIGNVKYYFFRNTSLAVAGMMLIIIGSRFFLQKERSSLIAYYKSLSVTDWFMYGFFISLLLSYLLTDFRKEAFWGAHGWYMGFVSQLLFILLYFFFSRYFKWNDKLLYLPLLASGCVFVLGILNRYSIYPLTIEGQTPTFIATLGNINWFCGYWALMCPLGVLWYWNSRDKYQQVFAAAYIVIGFWIGVVQGSSSAYLAFLGIFLFLFCISFRENVQMRRLLEIGIFFTVACQIARICRYLPGFDMNYDNTLGVVLTDTNAALYMMAALVSLYVLYCTLIRKRGYQIAQHIYIRNIGIFLALLAASGYLIVLMLNTAYPESMPWLAGQPLFTFNETWASSRGATWTDGILAFWHMPLMHKIVGAGPDCFSEYIYAVPELARRVYAQFGDARLTNAHNEWITMLVNQGVFGLVCYVGVFLTAIVRFLKKAPMQPVLYLCVGSVITYMAHNIVSFQQVLNAPYVFLLLGVGESLCKDMEKEIVDK